MNKILYDYRNQYEKFWYYDMEMSFNKDLPEKSIELDFNKKVEYRKIDEPFLPSVDQKYDNNFFDH